MGVGVCTCACVHECSSVHPRAKKWEVLTQLYSSMWKFRLLSHILIVTSLCLTYCITELSSRAELIHTTYIDASVSGMFA